MHFRPSRPRLVPLYRGKPFRITWGAAFVNTLDSGYPLDEVMCYPEPRAGSEQAQSASGVEDGWDAGTDNLLAGAWRWIPRLSGTTPEGRTITGWEGATGVAAFLSWARAKNILRFYPDPANFAATYVSCYLVEPMAGKPDPEPDYTRRLSAVFRTSDGVTAWDGY